MIVFDNILIPLLVISLSNKINNNNIRFNHNSFNNIIFERYLLNSVRPLSVILFPWILKSLSLGICDKTDVKDDIPSLVIKLSK